MSTIQGISWGIAVVLPVSGNHQQTASTAGKPPAGLIAADIEDVPTPLVFDPGVVFQEVSRLVEKAVAVLSTRVAAFSGAVPPPGLGLGVIIAEDRDIDS